MSKIVNTGYNLCIIDMTGAIYCLFLGIMQIARNAKI